MSKSKAGSMGKESASRIQSAADRNPDSDTSRSGFSERAQSAADRAEHEDQDTESKS